MFFLMFHNMSTQLVAYLVFSIPLYHSSQTFKFIKTFPYWQNIYEYLSLGDFASYYNMRKNKLSKCCK